MQLDLNLLPVFQVLYEERRVGRAALRLNLSQSAVSHALSRLRDAVGDQLFVRSPGGLIPTARAVALAPAVSESLARLNSAFSRGKYDPQDSTRRFRVAMGGYIGRVLAPPLIAGALERSPGCSLEIWNKENDVLDLLERGILDFAVGTFPDLPARFRCAPLFRERAIWIARSNHPSAFKARTLRDVLALPRVEITSGTAELNRSDAWLSSSSRFRKAWLDAPRPVVEVSLSQAAIDVVSRTDLVALVPERIVEEMAASVSVRPIPTDGPSLHVEVAMAWTQMNEDEPAGRWLRRLMVDVVAQARGEERPPPSPGIENSMR